VQELQRLLQGKVVEDAHAIEQNEAKREEARRRIETERGEVQEQIQELTRQRNEKTRRRPQLEAAIHAKQRELQELQQCQEEYCRWSDKQDMPGGYPELDEARQALDATNADISRLQADLETMLRDHDERCQQLERLFSGCVQTVLSSGSYDGKVEMKDRGLSFRITRGPAMSGEAVETLSVLLADVTSLLYNAANDTSHLPGFFVHDSPREADLGLRIYRSYLRLIAALHQHFGGRDHCPFQYIVTTTTPPPTEMQDNEDFVKLRLNAAEVSRLLLRRNISEPFETSPDPQLF